MNDSCPVPMPAERKYREIQSRIEKDMMLKVYAALQDAADQARAEIQAAGLEMPPSYGHLAAVIHQCLYCTLCGADPETFLGGKADTAIFVIRNCQNIARHYWGADIELSPKSRSSRSKAEGR